jgi:hypothetical protein
VALVAGVRAHEVAWHCAASHRACSFPEHAASCRNKRNKTAMNLDINQAKVKTKFINFVTHMWVEVQNPEVIYIIKF